VQISTLRAYETGRNFPLKRSLSELKQVVGIFTIPFKGLTLRSGTERSLNETLILSGPIYLNISKAISYL
jgi:hypothetical protein